MELNDSQMISQAMSTSVKEVETIYWVVETALDQGNISKAKALFPHLIYLGKYNPKVLKEGLQKPHLDRLQEITHELYGLGSIKKTPSITMRKEIISQKIPFKVEKELSDYLLKNEQLLSKAFGETVTITGREVELRNDYRCDIVAESDTVLYPIELKIAQSTHAVVSQCSKYCYYFYHKLRYDRFKHVQGVVISPGFDEWSVNALRKEGHWIFTITPTDSKHDISLEKID